MSIEQQPQHEEKTSTSFIIAVSILAVVTPALIIAILAFALNKEPVSEEFSDDAITLRIAPVASYNVLSPVAAAPVKTGPLSGEQVYNETCHTCHGAGLAGAPKVGDNAAWAPRIAEGAEQLFTHALKGFNAMPAKGGNPDLEDLEVERAVVYMINHSGGNLPEPK
ncbi:c-type cytochrome [Basilea psittacipulmonis]|uniref:Cytochrome c domain-containing protein n=1 Tax=Basilea psittacipulmonis DSM 24701 TaxID=1072685 RepID=A0A077DBG9_9BURK|nr:c-type cytochrome [Basilea psittacipulmonis]AIL32190.1 hypothetical protein IX83_01660 [Basilea psittacipulmonis DSM 24701]